MVPPQVSTNAQDAEISDAVIAAFEQVKGQSPLVHNITNYVAMDFSANALLAVGASPAMIHAVPEVEAFAAMSAAVVVNIGTLSPEWVKAMVAAQGATSAPVVLDPVGAGATPYRTSVAQTLLEQRPALVRGNASEIIALANASGLVSTPGNLPRGVDATDSVAAAEAVAIAMASASAGVVAVTGEVDFVTDGARHFRVRGGHPWMTQVTAVGCSLSAVCGAFLAVASEKKWLTATVAALALFKCAGENAAKQSAGPGTFRVHFLDALAAADADALKAVQIEHVQGPAS